jgi:hypothetical protein
MYAVLYADSEIQAEEIIKHAYQNYPYNLTFRSVDRQDESELEISHRCKDANENIHIYSA